MRRRNFQEIYIYKSIFFPLRSSRVIYGRISRVERFALATSPARFEAKVSTRRRRLTTSPKVRTRIRLRTWPYTDRRDRVHLFRRAPDLLASRLHKGGPAYTRNYRASGAWRLFVAITSLITRRCERSSRLLPCVSALRCKRADGGDGRRG